MEDTDAPDKIPVPWASSAAGAYINPIPDASQIGIADGYASWPDGFVPLNFLDPSVGGVPPRGQDMNGVLNEISAGLRWLQAGGLSSFDSGYATLIGGYPAGAVLSSSIYIGLLWISTLNNNVNNPDTGGVGWVPFNRWRLNGNVTLWVNSTGGSDANSGLSSGSPFATITRAITVLEQFIDLSGKVVTVNIQPGSYTDGIRMRSRIPGSSEGASSVIFNASAGTVTITTSDEAGAVTASEGAAFTLSGNDFVLSAPAGDSSVVSNIAALEPGSAITIAGNVTHDAARDSHVTVGSGSIVRYGNGLTENIADDAPIHWYCQPNGFLNVGFNNLIFNITGAPNFSDTFVLCDQGRVNAVGVTTVGAATGQRYRAALNGVINTDGGGANYFPGSVAGDATTGLYL